ncbi:hypothetical protein A3F28_02895 [Candidatus Uhrbacteria bacterium RIFCSPHIGHO2_12_FULL_57_11]|uniref:Uncharacterized protein n=1 Tax=Candidatus Uhrbacteria bacterium RIFCSPHIGHO2_12_FULL_57_11 TaxID=1802398 RepID=A0A1F7ULZ5_9BACT|nr:MAG: hypothetical protein A3F28_02895 [Candidatus Uhrbacteria bacterium RIFCSPHIGHO2_12_FULL_57_11]
MPRRLRPSAAALREAATAALAADSRSAPAGEAMKIPNAPQAVRTALEWLLNPERLLPGSVLVLSALAALAIGNRPETTIVRGFHFPKEAILAVRSSGAVDSEWWETVIGNFLRPETIDLFSEGAVNAVFDSIGKKESAIAVLENGDNDPFAVLLIPEDGRTEIDPGFEKDMSAFLAPRHPIAREMRLPDGTRYLEEIQDPSLFPFETVEMLGKRGRQLTLPDGGLVYLSLKGFTIIASTPDRLAAAFSRPKPRTLRLCPNREMVVHLQPDAWPVRPSAPFRPIINPFTGIPPFLYLPNTAFRIQTNLHTLILPSC